MNDSKNPDGELAIINNTLAQIIQSGFLITPIWVANFLVALKSKPLILLTGTTESAKEILVNCFSNVLTMGNIYHYQTMLGHPWWASNPSEVVTYNRVQSRFNTLKLESIIEEASLPQNRDQYFIAELIKISPGELEEYFSETAFQLQHKELMRLPSSHFSEPIPYPPNLSIIGTIDTSSFNWLDRDLLSQTTIIDCYPLQSANGLTVENFTPNPSLEKCLLHSSIRDPQTAFKKLSRILVKFPSGLLPFLQVRQVLQKFRSIWFGNSFLEGIVYLANSWSYAGVGLFDRDLRKNMQIAMDLAITQSLLLPHSEKIAKSEKLQTKLHKVLDNEFPQAIAYLNQLEPGIGISASA